MAHSEDNSVENGSPKGTRASGTKSRNHCKRFWWIYLFLLIIVVLVIVLPLVFVGYPNMAQKGVNDSSLEVKSMTIADPTLQSFRLEQDTILHSPSKHHPNLDAFNASVSLKKANSDSYTDPFTYVYLPAVVPQSETPVNIDQKVPISSLEAYTEYCTAVMNQEELVLKVSGRTGLKQGSLKKITVDYNKYITMKGLNKLKGFNVTSFQVLNKPEPDGSNMAGKVYIPNASVQTLYMGNLTMNLSVKGQAIGTSSINDLVLKPGNNTVDMRSKADQSKVLGVLSDYKDGMVPVDIVGNSSVYNGVHLTYYEKALQSNKVQVTLNIGAAVSGLLSGGGAES